MPSLLFEADGVVSDDHTERRALCQRKPATNTDDTQPSKLWMRADAFTRS